MTRCLACMMSVLSLCNKQAAEGQLCELQLALEAHTLLGCAEADLEKVVAVGVVEHARHVGTELGAKSLDAVHGAVVGGLDLLQLAIEWPPSGGKVLSPPTR